MLRDFTNILFKFHIEHIIVLSADIEKAFYPLDSRRLIMMSPDFSEEVTKEQPHFKHSLSNTEASKQLIKAWKHSTLLLNQIKTFLQPNSHSYRGTLSNQSTPTMSLTKFFRSATLSIDPKRIVKLYQLEFRKFDWLTSQYTVHRWSTQNGAK